MEVYTDSKLWFSNSWTIHQVKKKKIWRSFGYPVLISIDFDHFTFPFTRWVLFRLRRHTKHSRHCFISYPTTSYFVKNTPLLVVFSTFFSVFGCLDEHCLSCLIYCIESKRFVSLLMNSKIGSFRLGGASQYNINIGLCVLMFQSAQSIHLAQRVRFMDWGTLQEIDWVSGRIKGNNVR